VVLEAAGGSMKKKNKVLNAVEHVVRDYEKKERSHLGLLRAYKKENADLKAKVAQLEGELQEAKGGQQK